MNSPLTVVLRTACCHPYRQCRPTVV